MGELELPDVSGASHLVRDMILVVAMGGITGAITLAQSASSVPEHFSDRISYIQNIVNIGCGKKFIQIQFLISLVDALPCSKDLLRQVSEKTSVVHTAFLAPPVSRCILPECRQASLSRPHPPIHATIFTLNGPLPALKCSLRCNKCATVYNYSMYGRKKQGGERYYDKQRKYMEVSDLVYCER